TVSGSEPYDLRTSPILVTAAKESLYIITALVVLGLIVTYVPLIDILALPFLGGLFHLTLFIIGLLLEILFVTPRIFLGSFIDSFLLPATATPDEGLLSRKGNVGLLVLAVSVAAITSVVWLPSYNKLTAEGHEYFEQKKARRALYLTDWNELNKII